MLAVNPMRDKARCYVTNSREVRDLSFFYVSSYLWNAQGGAGRGGWQDMAVHSRGRHGVRAVCVGAQVKVKGRVDTSGTP
jgi:hypothetical protein